MACAAAVKAVREELYAHEESLTPDDVCGHIRWWHIDTIREALDALVGAGVAKQLSGHYYPVGPLR
jgi:hypothetical protein